MNSQTTPMGQQIVVMDRGYAYYGEVTRDADTVTITNAKNIRRWGTTRGLGQLAKDGPQPNTQLDDAGTVVAPMRAVIHFIACAKPW